MLDKIWAQHVIVPRPGSEDLLFVDLNLLHEGGTFLAFDQLRAEGRKVRKPRQTLAITDHYLPSVNRAAGIPGIVNPEIRPEGALARAGLNACYATTPPPAGGTTPHRRRGRF